MFLSVDLGGSTIDILRFEGSEYSVLSTLDSSSVDKTDLKDIFQHSAVDWKKAHKIVLTGGHSRKFGKVFENIPVEIISEIDAIGAGGLFLTETDSALVCSLGTGTCFVSAENGRYLHVGGTGIGGGTFLGLSRVLLQTDNFSQLQHLTQMGDATHIDLLVEEIVGSGIGMVPGSATAANFAKATPENKKEDIARGIANMVGQTIASLAVFASQMKKHNQIILGGKLIRLPHIVETVKKTADIYNREILIPKNAEYLSAVGAGILSGGIPVEA